MNNQLERTGAIDSGVLNGEFYFASLVEQATIHGMLSMPDMQKLQYDCLALLAKLTEKFSGGYSSSVPVERAQSLMASLLFTVSLALKEYSHPDDAVQGLREKPLEEFYQRGRLRINKLLSSTKTIHAKLCKELIQTKNTCYYETLVDGIQAFFQNYDPDFGAHEIHITADYPLLLPMPPLAGIEFIKAYVNAACHENRFCVFFDADTLHHLFLGCTEDYPNQIFNLCEPVFHTALGCILCGTDPHGLNMTTEGRTHLEKLFQQTPEKGLPGLLNEALSSVFQFFDCTDGLQIYLKDALALTVSGIKAALKIGTLHRLFPLLSYGDEAPQFLISYGSQMDDEIYRKILNAINNCDDTKSRLVLVYEHIHSLADLETLFLDADFTEEEVLKLLSQLSLPEAAALIRRYRPILEEDCYGLLETELRLRGHLKVYLDGLPTEKLQILERTEKRLKDL